MFLMPLTQKRCPVLQCQHLHDTAVKALYQVVWRKKHLQVNNKHSEHDHDYNDQS